MIPVPIATENLPLFNAPDHDVVQSAGSIDARFSWHEKMNIPSKDQPSTLIPNAVPFTAKDFVAQEIHDEEISITGKSSRWNQDHYQRAQRILGSLGAFMASKMAGQWDGGVIDDEDGIDLSAEWMTIYDRLDCHGMISACDFLADILGKLTAAGEREHRPFMISHAPLAALAVLLHDWRMWDHAKNWKLIPVDIGQNPLAAILIYIDTWDDYKRKPGDPVVSITEYEVNPKGARVLVEWENEAALHDQDQKYKSFGESLTGGPPKLKIETRTR